MGASGLAAGLLLLGAGLLLAALMVAGLVLVVAGAFARRKQGSPPLIWTGAALLSTGLVVVTATLAWARIAGDPETLELDLREPISAASLDKEDMPGYPGVYDYGSDRLELVLPDGSRFATDVFALTVWTHAGTVTSVRANARAQPWADAVDVATRWADDLGVETTGLDAESPRDWSTTTTAGGAGVSISVQLTSGTTPSPGVDGEEPTGKPFLSFGPLDG